jgi:hypothetical protein
MKRTNKIGIVTISIATILMLLAGYFVYRQQKSANDEQLNFMEFPPTPVINSVANLQFIETIIGGKSNEINTGLTIERLNIVAIEGIPTPSVNHVSLLILNHTQEPIAFEDIGFGVQVFEYDPSLSEWRKVALPYTPEQKQKVIPPQLETFDFEVLNSWEFTSGEFIDVRTGILRILIRGMGVNSGKNYYAFVDVTLQK